MSPVYTLLISMILILIGINLAANNMLHSYIITYIFHADKSSSLLLRVLGLTMIASVLLLIFDMHWYTLLANILIGILFTFLAIKGRSKARETIRLKEMQIQREHNEEIKRRRSELDTIKKRKREELDQKAAKNKPQSVKEIKDNIWDDGSLSNKEIIDTLNK